MGTPTAPAWAMPRSATVHSTRVLAMMETISPFFTPNATSPQAVSSPSCASWAQLTSCHAPATLRRAAVRCASCAARCWKSCATELTLASSLRCFCIAFRWLSAVAMVLLPAGLVVGHPLPCPVLQALVIGWIAAAALGVEDFLYQLAALVRARVADERIGEVDLRPPVARVRLDRLGEDPDRLVHVPLGPRQLVEVAPPDHLGRAVEKVPVDLQRGLEAVAELSFQPLGERGEDAHALRVEPHADTGVIVAAHVLRIGEDGLVAGFPRLLSQRGLLVAVGAVGFPVEERGEAPVGFERAGLDGELLADDALELLLDARLVALLPQVVEALPPPRRTLGGRQAGLRRDGRTRLGRPDRRGLGDSGGRKE